jgi:serine/threonine-protein kinase
MGAVWLADDLSLDSPCAVKLIDAEKSRSEEVRKRFIREAKAAAQLRGPHVVDVFDRGESDGVLYIAMEYLEGEDLCTRLGRVGILDPERTYRIVAHVSRALSSAHALGIVHRDLKPENIFLVQSYDEEIAKVVDFGIAQHAAYRLQDKATREGSFLGTPYYVSPEQARGRETDHRSDLWSLAVITYQCLTGVPPFDSDSLGDLMGLILYEPIPKITVANPDLPPAIEQWWTRATQRDRELRFQSARELTDQLGRALGLKTVISVPTIPPRRQSSYPDDGEHRLLSGSLPPLRTPQLLMQSAPLALSADDARIAETVEVAAVEAKDPLSVTEVVVTRTRPSLRPVKLGLEWGYARLKAFPKRPLVIVAVGAGILVGALITFAVSSRSQRIEALSPEPSPSALHPVALGASSTAPTASASTVEQLQITTPDVLPIIPPQPDETRRTESPSRRQTGAPAPVGQPAKKQSGTPDYGI